MIRRKIIFPSSNTINNVNHEEKYYENKIRKVSKNCVELNKKKKSSNTKNTCINYEKISCKIIERIKYFLSLTNSQNNKVFVFGENSDRTISYVIEYFSKDENYIVLDTIYQNENNRDIYQNIIAYINGYILANLTEKWNSNLTEMRKFNEMTEMAFKERLGNLKRSKILVDVIECFLNELIMDRKRKLIIPIYFYNQLMDEKVLRMVERILTDNRVVFIMGTNMSYDNQVALMSSIFFSFNTTFGTL